MIKAALDYIPQNTREFFSHFLNCFSFSKFNDITISNNDKYRRISGYSCRSLFDTTLKYYVNLNPDLKILTTPIHHTSFRNIIEKYVKHENIFILELNQNFNEISGIPQENGIDVIVDLCIITHLFGQDMNCDILEKYSKDNPNCIMIEDRVQGGEFNEVFSNNFMDISLYSTGMDKKPCGLGGGFLCVNNNNNFLKKWELLSYLKLTILNYPKENNYQRLLFLSKKLPTFLLYNCRSFISLILSIFSYFELDLHNFSSKYRKANPGFSHDDYNKNPSSATLKSIEQSFTTCDRIENLYKQKTLNFYSNLNNETLKKMIPWLRNGYSLTPYNTVSVDDRDKFIKYLNNMNIPVLENPTYKIFNFKFDSIDKYKNFNDSLVYIPSLALMTNKEIEYLALLINNYHSKNN